MTILRDLWDGILHLAFPEVCLGCMQQESRRNDFLCLECLYNLPYTNHFNPQDNAFERHFIGRVKIKKGAALFIYTKIVENLIHQYKYEGILKIGMRFGAEIGEKIKSSSIIEKVDLILPIPLHPAKFKKRGFNQSLIIAKEIGKIIDVQVDNKILQRSRKTKTQTSKSRENRIENLRFAFEVKSDAQIAGKNILLIDDVLTTGATLESAALTLKHSGAGEINMITLAMGQS